MRTISTTRGIPALMRLVVMAVFLSLLLPALAFGQESAPAADPPASEAPAGEAPASEAPAPPPDSSADPAPAEEPAPAEQPAPAEEPAPAEQPAPPPAEEPAAEGPGTPAEEPSTAPPPSSEAPSEPSPAPAPTPRPDPQGEAPPVTGTPTPAPAPEPVLAPSLPELVPVPIVGVPDDAVRPPLLAVVDAVPDALPASRAPATPAGPVAVAASVIAIPPTSTGFAGALGAPATPIVRQALPRALPVAVAEPVEIAQVFGGDRPSGAFAAPVATQRSDSRTETVASTEKSAVFDAAQVTAPQGSAPTGASLLEVLAGYVLPGSSGPPASSIIFLVLLGTLLMALYAPRPQVSERIHLLGLLGPRSGHALAVRRPG